MQKWFDRTHDPLSASDLDPIAHLEGKLTAQVAGGNHLVGAPKLIAIVDPSHRGSERYVPQEAMRADLRWRLLSGLSESLSPSAFR